MYADVVAAEVDLEFALNKRLPGQTDALPCGVDAIGDEVVRAAEFCIGVASDAAMPWAYMTFPPSPRQSAFG